MGFFLEKFSVRSISLFINTPAERVKLEHIHYDSSIKRAIHCRCVGGIFPLEIKMLKILIRIFLIMEVDWKKKYLTLHSFLSHVSWYAFRQVFASEWLKIYRHWEIWIWKDEKKQIFVLIWNKKAFDLTSSRFDVDLQGRGLLHYSASPDITR